MAGPNRNKLRKEKAAAAKAEHAAERAAAAAAAASVNTEATATASQGGVDGPARKQTQTQQGATAEDATEADGGDSVGRKEAVVEGEAAADAGVVEEGATSTGTESKKEGKKKKTRRRRRRKMTTGAAPAEAIDAHPEKKTSHPPEGVPGKVCARARARRHPAPGWFICWSVFTDVCMRFIFTFTFTIIHGGLHTVLGLFLRAFDPRY